MLFSLYTQPCDNADRFEDLSVSFSIYRSRSSIKDLEDMSLPGNRSNHVLVKFYSNDVRDAKDFSDEYHAILGISSESSIRLEIFGLHLPTGRYNIYFKIAGQCRIGSIARYHKITVQHNLSHLNHEVGVIDHWEQLQWNSQPNDSQNFGWKWVPVYSKANSRKLLTVDYNFEKGDELSVKLETEVPGLGKYNLSFHMIRFVLATV
jgi:hypothetical protein